MEELLDAIMIRRRDLRSRDESRARCLDAWAASRWGMTGVKELPARDKILAERKERCAQRGSRLRAGTD